MRFFSKKYSKEHEWIEKSGQNYHIGISDYAQDKLGEVVYIDFPEKGTEVEKNGEIGEIESTKAVSVIYAPVDLTILNNNSHLEENYSQINRGAEDTWIFEVRVKDESELDDLMDEKEYEHFVKEQK